MMTLIGNVIPKAIGRKSPGFASGTACFIAAGTAMYEALAPKIANKSWLPGSEVICILISNAINPLINGIILEKRNG